MTEDESQDERPAKESSSTGQREPVHVSHADPTIAYHVKWGFRREAVLWNGDFPVGINLHPLAGELRSWLLRSGSFALLSKDDNDEPDSLSNPYTYAASVLAANLARAVSASHAFATGEGVYDGMEGEAERIRIYNELTIYMARFCEAAIKQLLYCTQIPPKYYEHASLGPLLSTECMGCKASKSQRHKISLLGSLAHRYHLCIPFEKCLFDHLNILRRRRNAEAAHSGSQTLRKVSVEAAREKMQEDSLAAGNDFVHMLDHISQLESRIVDEITRDVLNYQWEHPRKVSIYFAASEDSGPSKPTSA